MTAPFYPQIDGKAPYEVAQAIRTAYELIHKMNARLEAHEKAGYVTRDQALKHLGPVASRNNLQIGGRAPLNVTGLLGQLAQPQIAQAPSESSLPSLGSPLSQDGTLISVNDQVYRFDGTTDPGKWVAITAEPATTPVAVSDGGTGDTSLAAHGVLIGEGTSPVNVVSPGTAGDVLTSNGPSADPSFQPAGSGSGVTSLDSITGAVQLVAGANVTITDNSPSAGKITIASSGGGGGGGGLLSIFQSGDTFTPPTTVTFPTHLGFTAGTQFLDLNSGVVFSSTDSPGGDTNRVALMGSQLPAPPWTLTAYIKLAGYGPWVIGGLALEDATQSHLISYGIDTSNNNGANSGWFRQTWYNAGSGDNYAGTTATLTQLFGAQYGAYFRLQDDGTNLSWSVGQTLSAMHVLDTRSQTAFLTPAYAGLLIDPINGSSDLFVLDWKVTTP